METKTIRLMKHYATNGTDKARVHYSHSVLTNGRECVTIYSKDYSNALANVFGGNGYENDTDIMTDYFDKGRVRIYPDHPLYAAAVARAA